MAAVPLPVTQPLGPMLAKSVKTIPSGDFLYEPKWDGFRCIAFRDGDEVELASRGEKPLTRYFPEVVEALKANLPKRCVVDGEIVIATGDRLDFEALLQRIHPAESRVRKLAEETPASFVAFDLLAEGDASMLQEPLRDAPGPAGEDDGQGLGAGLPDAGDPRHRDGPEVVRGVRGGRPGRGGREAARLAVPARRTRDVQDQARAHGRLRGRGLPLAQVRAGRRLAAARPVRRGRWRCSTSGSRRRSR